MGDESKISYALVGSGRLARHLSFYLKSLEIPLIHWSRESDPQQEHFDGTVSLASHVLLAVSDRAIAELAAKCLPSHTVVHFSGALNLPGVHAAHPLMTFSDKIQEPIWYRKIPFIVDEGLMLSDVLPGLPNPFFALKPELRPLYHALCSLAGNSAFLLWQQIGDVFEKQLSLPRQLLTPFLQQVVVNSSYGDRQDLTGPVVREDWQTVASHLDALEKNPPLRDAYKMYLGLAGQEGISVPKDLL